MTFAVEEAGQILSQDARGRVLVSRERRESLLEEYDRSGMSGVKFAQYVGIKYSTLPYWLQSRRRHRRREKLLIKAGADTGAGKSTLPAQAERAVFPVCSRRDHRSAQQRARGSKPACPVDAMFKSGGASAVCAVGSDHLFQLGGAPAAELDAAMVYGCEVVELRQLKRHGLHQTEG